MQRGIEVAAGTADEIHHFPLHSSVPPKLDLKTIIQSSLRSEGETRQEGDLLKEKG